MRFLYQSFDTPSCVADFHFRTTAQVKNYLRDQKIKDGGGGGGGGTYLFTVSFSYLSLSLSLSLSLVPNHLLVYLFCILLCLCTAGKRQQA